MNTLLGLDKSLSCSVFLVLLCNIQWEQFILIKLGLTMTLVDYKLLSSQIHKTKGSR